MPPELGGIPGRDYYWEVPLALMLSPGWLHPSASFIFSLILSSLELSELSDTQVYAP